MQTGATRAALTLRGVTKRFGPTLAVDALDLEVPRGSFYGLVGPNGAGKTTTLSMATGLLRPDAGSVDVLGADVWADPVRAKQLVGVLPDGLRLFDRLTGHRAGHLLGPVARHGPCGRRRSAPVSCSRPWASPTPAACSSSTTPPV